MVLVVGATGLVGNEVCHRLRRLGEQVRALVRTTSSRDKIETLRSSGAELCIGDLKDPRSIRCCLLRRRLSNLNRLLNIGPTAWGLNRVCGWRGAVEPRARRPGR